LFKHSNCGLPKALTWRVTANLTNAVIAYYGHERVWSLIE